MRQKSASRIAAIASASSDGALVSARPTPAARDHKGSGTATTRADGKLRNDMLDWAAERFWRTPTDDSRRGGPADPASRKQQGHTVNLQDQATYWKTPNVPNGGRAMDPQTSLTGQHPDGRKRQVDLGAQARLWSTPRVAVGAYTRDRGVKGSERLTLEGEAVCHSVRPDQETPTDGEPSSKDGPPWNRPERSLRPSLNPLFVEWLMGWPIGWTGCACAETEFTRWRSQMASALASIDLSPGVQPQTSLF
ncbi:MAG: hypothetical protein VX529_06495 [Pseudomonadota bacterium]|nr:hypothetical protein [Pseudomonadota bacterium]